MFGEHRCNFTSLFSNEQQQNLSSQDNGELRFSYKLSRKAVERDVESDTIIKVGVRFKLISLFTGQMATHAPFSITDNA